MKAFEDAQAKWDAAHQVWLTKMVRCLLEPQAASPVVTDSSSNVPGNRKVWTPEKLAELKAYREAHTMPETATKFGISEQRIRHLLPSNKPKQKGYSAFTHRIK